MKKTALIAGATGVAGRTLLAHLRSLPDWDVIGVSRRRPDFETTARWVEADLLDERSSRAQLGKLKEVTHVFYVAFADAPTFALQRAPNTTMLVNAVEAIGAAGGALEHVCLLQGTKYYGNHLTLRLFVWFYAVMAAAGLIVEGLFALAGIIPESRPATIVMTHFEWNYTTFLNIAFLAVLALLYWLYRNRERLGGGQSHATDPVCGMQVEKANAPAHIVDRGVKVWFCSDGCRERYEREPDQHRRGGSDRR